MAEADGVGPAGAPLPGAMPNRLPENAPAADFDPKAVAKSLLRATRAGALATIDRNTGHPFASLVNAATDADGSPLILVSARLVPARGAPAPLAVGRAPGRARSRHRRNK